MKGTPDCIPCLLRRTLQAARHIADDPWLHRKVLSEVMGHLQKADLDRAPAELVSEVMKVACKALGSPDAFAKVKESHRLEAKALEDGLRKRIAEADEPLREAIRLAARANALDAAVFGAVSLDEAIGASGSGRRLAIDDSGRLIQALEGAEQVLYICDNAAEILVDRLVIERILEREKLVTCVVRRAPVANDATDQDAQWAGLADICAVIDTGATGTGMPLALVAGEVRQRFDAADLVIAKGSANYQTLESEPKAKYFLMAIKCQVVGRHLGVSVGDVVIYGD